jgi:hypothetical protein
MVPWLSSTKIKPPITRLTGLPAGWVGPGPQGGMHNVALDVIRPTEATRLPGLVRVLHRCPMWIGYHCRAALSSSSEPVIGA